MRPFCVILTLLAYCSAFSQEISENESEKESHKVVQYAIFPGCEKYKGDNNKLSNCFATNLRTACEFKLEILMDEYIKKYKSKNKNIKEKITRTANFQLSINNLGRLEVVGIKEGSDDELAKDAKPIITGAIQNLIVEPAKLDDGRSVGITVNMPVTFTFDW